MGVVVERVNEKFSVAVVFREVLRLARKLTKGIICGYPWGRWNSDGDSVIFADSRNLLPRLSIPP